MGHLLLPRCRITLVQSPSRALRNAGSCWHVLSLQGRCRSSPGDINALRAAGAPGATVVFPPAAHSWGHMLLGCGRPGHHPCPCSLLLAGHCGMVPCQGGCCRVPCCHTQAPAHLPSHVEVQFGGHTLPDPFLKHKESSLRGC